MSLFLLPGRRSQDLYDAVSDGSAAVVIRRYSSSFGLASRLLAAPQRPHVRNVYALVRIADEIVDRPDPGLTRESRARMLDWLHDDVRHALRTGYSGNVVVHAFARTATWCGITDDLVDPFFASMRMDLETTVHSPETIERYIYGSAEVVGLMCLRVFLTEGSAERGWPSNGRTEGGPGTSASAEYERLAPGARRLGAAFQKLNFLRDLAEDHDVLVRRYFPGLDVDRFSDADRDRILDDIDADLAAAAAAIPELPASSRLAVRVAQSLFVELAARLRATPAARIRRTRVRVPDRVKLRLVAGALHGSRS